MTLFDEYNFGTKEEYKNNVSTYLLKLKFYKLKKKLYSLLAAGYVDNNFKIFILFD